MVKKIRILFVCVENSFRSQIAESIMKKSMVISLKWKVLD